MFVDEEEVVEEAAAEEVVEEVVEEAVPAESETATEEEASEEDQEEAEDDTVIKPAWQTEEHHLDAHALRRQAIMIGRPNVAWTPPPSNAWALTQPVQPIVREYDDLEDEETPFNFIADPQVALDAMADYHNFQARMHRQLGTILD
jgi:hypothetical protein